MNDKNDFDMPSDDELYDDALDENFEFDDDDIYTDLDLDSDLEESASESDDALEDEWDDGAAVAPAEKKKSKFGLSFNTIVIIGAIIVGVFVMMSQINKEKAAIEVENPTEVNIPTALKMEGAFSGPGAIKEKKQESNSTVSVKEETPAEGFLFDDDVLDDASDIVVDAPPMPSPIVSEQDGIIEKQDVVEEVQDALQASEQAPEDNGDAQVPNEPDDIDVAFGQDEAVAEAVQQVVKKSEGENSAVLQGENDVVAVPEQVSKKIILDDSQSNSLGQKLDNIIQRLESMENKISEIESGNNNRFDAVIADIENLKQKKGVVSQVKSAPRPQKEKIAQTKEVVKAVKKKTPKQIVKAVRWELRAAQPGKAWVSRKGQSNMQPVVVGDKLAGIGRVQSINHVKGRWIVQGSTGKIMQ